MWGPVGHAIARSLKTTTSAVDDVVVAVGDSESEVRSVRFGIREEAED